MKKEYIKPDCVAQVLTVKTFLLTGFSDAAGEDPAPWDAPARRTNPF
jgi:hypothetical protein